MEFQAASQSMTCVLVYYIMYASRYDNTGQVITERSRSDVSLMEQETIKNVS